VCQGTVVARNVNTCAMDASNFYCLEMGTGAPVTIAKATGVKTPLSAGGFAPANLTIVTDGAYVYVLNGMPKLDAFSIPCTGGSWAHVASMQNASGGRPAFLLGSSLYWIGLD